MKQRKIAVIAGTSDATDWIRSLPETDSVTAFVATPYGKEILAGTNCTVHVGRLDAAGFAEALTGFDEVVDASHPFAVVVTETVKAVCQAKQIPYTRISRPTLHYDYEKLHIVSSKEAAADWLCSCTGNLFFTVGVQTLPFYAAAVTDFSHRAFARVLDTAASRQGSRSRSGNVLVCNAALFYSRNGCLLAGASDFCFDFQGQRSKRRRAGEDTSSQTGGNSGLIDTIARTNRTIICIKSIMKYSESCYNLRTIWKWIFLLDNFFKKCYDES